MPNVSQRYCLPSARLTIFVMVNEKPETPSDVSIHKTIYRYNKIDSDSSRSYFVEAPYLALFKSGRFRTTSFISEWIITGIENIICHQMPTKAKMPALVHT